MRDSVRHVGALLTDQNTPLRRIQPESYGIATGIFSFRDSWLATTISAASSSSPATSRYHQRPCRFSASSRRQLGGACRPPAAGWRRAAGDRRDELAAGRAASGPTRPGRCSRRCRSGRADRVRRRRGSRRRPARSARAAAARSPRIGDALAGRRHDDAVGLRLEQRRQIDDLADGRPRRRLLVLRQVAHELVHERQVDRLQRQVVPRVVERRGPARSRGPRRRAAPPPPPRHRRTARARGRSGPASSAR